nr:MAG TPA: hypothetical protein [Crassvirales sp.]
MKIQSKISKFQQGGAAPVPQDPAAGGAPAEGAPMEGGAPEGAPAGNPMEQILQVAAQAVQTGNCEAALAVCQTLMSATQRGMGPGEAPQEEPTFARNGSKLRRVR